MSNKTRNAINSDMQIINNYKESIATSVPNIKSIVFITISVVLILVVSIVVFIKNKRKKEVLFY